MGVWPVVAKYRVECRDTMFWVCCVCVEVVYWFRNFGLSRDFRFLKEVGDPHICKGFSMGEVVFVLKICKGFLSVIGVVEI